MSELVTEYTPEVLEQLRKGEEIAEQEAVSEEAEAEQPTLSKYEEAAKAEGWTTLEEWEERGKDPEDWVDAGEFVRRGELMTRIKGQTKAIKGANKRIEELEAAVRTFGEHNKKLAKIEYEKAKRDLRKQKIEAMEDRDHEAVLEIEDKITELDAQADELEETNSKSESKEDAPSIPEPIEKWTNDPNNSWYNDDPALRAEADRLAVQYGKRHFDPDLAPQEQPWEDMLSYIEQYIAAKYPEKFGGEGDDDEQEEVVKRPKVRKKSPVAEPGTTRSGKSGKKKTKLSVADLSEDEHAAYKEFVVRQKIMSADEYLKQLEEIKSI